MELTVLMVRRDSYLSVLGWVSGMVSPERVEKQVGPAAFKSPCGHPSALFTGKSGYRIALHTDCSIRVEPTS